MRILKCSIFALIILLSNVTVARVDINLNEADVIVVDTETLLIRNVEAINLGNYWSLFRWNAETMTFDLQEYGLQETVEDFCRENNSPAICTSQSTSDTTEEQENGLSEAQVNVLPETQENGLKETVEDHCRDSSSPSVCSSQSISVTP